MYKYEERRYINAGENVIYRWGKKAREKAAKALEPNEAGYYNIPADGGNYWTIGTSNGKYGEYAKFGDTFLSVNKAGNVWAKAGTPKADAFVAMVEKMIDDMKNAPKWNAPKQDEDKDEDEE